MEINCEDLVKSAAALVVQCHEHSGVMSEQAVVDEVCAAYVWGSLDYAFAILAKYAPAEKIYSVERGTWIYLTRGKAMSVLRSEIAKVSSEDLTTYPTHFPTSATDSLWFGLDGPLLRIFPEKHGGQ